MLTVRPMPNSAATSSIIAAESDDPSSPQPPAGPAALSSGDVMVTWVWKSMIGGPE